MTEPKRVVKRKIDLFETEAADDDNKDEAVEGEEIFGEGDGVSTNSNKIKSKSVERATRDDEINAFRNRLQIKAKGNNVPNPAATFGDMKIFPDLKPIIIANIEESTWKEPTPIQMQAITVMLEGTVFICDIGL